MMKKLILFGFMMMLGGLVYSQQFIADYTVAKEDVLRSIPDEVIDQARNDIHLLYIHTSHGTHVTRGLFGLEQYKAGDDVTFAVTDEDPTDNKLDMTDVYGYDVSNNRDVIYQMVRDSLMKNPTYNTVMLAWCWANTAKPYLDSMSVLIDEYGEGGSKIGTGAGQRETPVKFIFMTAHANGVGNTDQDNVAPKADSINKFCNEHHYLCLDYYSIDTHDMNDNYWDDATDNAVSAKYHAAGGTTDNFYQDYQDSHTLGSDWFYGRNSYGAVDPGEHVTQHITCNRKGYAMWWILARLTGWGGTPTAVTAMDKKKIDLVYNNNLKQLIIKDIDISSGVVCHIYNLTGSLCFEKQMNSSSLSLAELQKGLYIVTVNSPNGIVSKKILIR